MLTEPEGPFIDVGKLNMAKYAQKPALAKVSEWKKIFCIKIYLLE